MIIFGSSGFEKDLGESSLEIECQNCHNHVTLQIKEIGKKFSLFFIPLFKTSSKHYALCPICKHGYSMTKDDLPKYLAQ